jgi:hypothetical protein
LILGKMTFYFTYTQNDVLFYLYTRAPSAVICPKNKPFFSETLKAEEQ